MSRSRLSQRYDVGQSLARNGIDTATGVRLDPRVGEPAAGLDYLPDHTIIEFGRKAGERGPDLISVDPNGEITLLDSKWRGADTSISPSGRAHQTENSIRNALKYAEKGIPKAGASGRLPPEAAARAQENLAKGNVTIVTVGTGSARNGVIERIVGGERAVVYPKRRP